MTNGIDMSTGPEQKNAIGEALTAQWGDVLDALRSEVGDAAYKSWLKPMVVREITNGLVRISVPTRFMRDWISAHYVDRLSALWQKLNKDISAVDVFVQTERRPSLETPAQIQSRKNAQIATKNQPLEKQPSGRIASPQIFVRSESAMRPESPVQEPAVHSGPLDKRFTFDNFVVGKPNEFAHAASRRVAEAEAVPFNPLFLYGGVGLGKTHLMHAIAWHLRQTRPEIRVAYMSAEKFMYRFIRALREQNTVDFKEQLRSVDVLMIDDVQFIAGKDSTQEEFFHTFNSLVDQGKQIVISADKSPSDLEGMEERLVSRLNCGLVADIHATTYELRLGILQSKAEQMSMEVPRKVMEFLAHRITANVRELEGGLNRVVAHSQLIGREITLEATQEVLHDLLRANDRRITIEEIQKKVSAHFNIRMSDMHSARRARSVARPRQVAMYLAKQLTARSLPEIGRKFGNRDHTTVMYAVKKVDELREHDSGFAEDVDLLRRMLEA